MKNTHLFSATIALAVTASSYASVSPGSTVLKFSKPAKNWERESLPLGNGSLGVNVFGGEADATIQFTVDSLWTGGENPSGSYSLKTFGAFQNFGEIHFKSKHGKVEDYQRQLDIRNAIHTTTWTENGVKFTREVFVSYPDKVMVWRISADKPKSISGTFTFSGAHPKSDKYEVSSNRLWLNGEFKNKLQYAAALSVRNSGGALSYEDNKIVAKDCSEVVAVMAANTNYVIDLDKKWMSGTAKERSEKALDKVSKESWKLLKQRHLADYQKYFNRVTIDLGKSNPDLVKQDLNQRIQNYRQHAKNLPRPCLDPELEAMLFNYGRYLLISSSRPGSLPANLQGIWNNSNNPAWHSDYHTNINLQMCYWLAEPANLSEMTAPLFDMLTEQAPVYRKYTIKQYGETPGYVTRMSVNIYGGGGWNWNIEGTAWLAQHFYEHYAFTGDKKFLKETAYPWLRDVSKFWLPRLKKTADGKLVVPNAWSHEHGPYEDGTAHAQQLMWDLFTNTLNAAKELGIDEKFQKQLSTTIDALYGPKIGSWGQLMEWMEEKPDLEKSHHRHTSHLFAVFPGNQISIANTPKLAQGAIVSLTQRGEVGDSRRSWAWAWRTALWARLGKSERAHGCVAGLLAYNMLDNLWTTHPPFQIDGSMGITAGMVECLLQSHSGVISILPALPKAWPTGSVTGLKARGDITVDIAWKKGTLAKVKFVSAVDQTITLQLPGEKKKQVKLIAGKEVIIE